MKTEQKVEHYYVRGWTFILGNEFVFVDLISSVLVKCTASACVDHAAITSVTWSVWLHARK